MGMIQGSINQLLQMAQIGAALDPRTQQKAEAHQLKSELKGLEEAEKQIPSGIEEGSTEEKIYNQIQLDKARASHKLFKAEPTKENYRGYVKSRWSAGDPVMTIKATPEEIMQEQAELEAQKNLELEQKRLQKTRETLMANTTSKIGQTRGGTIKYDNI